MEIEPKILLENKSVTILSLKRDDQVFFMPTSWNLPISYRPPMVMVCVGEKRFTHQMISSPTVDSFTLSVPYDKKIVEKLGSISGRDVDKVKEFGLKYDPESLCPAGCLGFVKAKIIERKQYGTHLMVIGEVTESQLFTVGTEKDPKKWMLWSIGGGKKIMNWGEE